MGGAGTALVLVWVWGRDYRIAEKIGGQSAVFLNLRILNMCFPGICVRGNIYPAESNTHWLTDWEWDHIKPRGGACCVHVVQCSWTRETSTQ